jgi:hypothetical protein
LQAEGKQHVYFSFLMWSLWDREHL